MARPQARPTVRIDDGRVKATEWAFDPGAETGWHVHEHDYVVVPLVSGTLKIEMPDGTSSTAELTQGIPYARKVGVEHNVINDGPGEMRFLEVEITG
ncbi:cupin domain-containing protein [Microbaculum marinum]|uniref:Cupin domain-containing protein n=1 Tax=Microbaculum marinum TaxID=1764581 RepID=A0AAW9RR96_9HYPH